MTNLSYNMTTALLEGHEMEPDKLTKSTDAPTNDMDVRLNLTNVKNRHQAIRFLKLVIRRLEDGRAADSALV